MSGAKSRKRRRAAGGCVISTLALAAWACSTTEPDRGGLMLILSSDGALPIDRLQVTVNSNDELLLNNSYRLPAEAQLPTTVAIVSNGDERAQASITVVAWQRTPQGDEVPVDRRDAIVTQIPTGRVAELRVVLSARCSSKVSAMDGVAQSACPAGQTCQPSTGACGSAEIDASTLETYRPGSENDVGAGGSPGETPGDGGAGGGAGTAGSPGSCVGISCDSPPPAACESATQLTAYDAVGSCNSGQCQYNANRIPCDCQSGACTTDPCLSVTCATPPSAGCKDATTRTTYAASGECSLGSCSYPPTDTPCGSNKQCDAGVCNVCKSDAACGASCTACTGTNRKCKDLGDTSGCVQCLSNADCTGDARVCKTSTNTCISNGRPPKLNSDGSFTFIRETEMTFTFIDGRGIWSSAFGVYTSASSSSLVYTLFADGPLGYDAGASDVNNWKSSCGDAITPCTTKYTAAPGTYFFGLDSTPQGGAIFTEAVGAFDEVVAAMPGSVPRFSKLTDTGGFMSTADTFHIATSGSGSYMAFDTSTYDFLVFIKYGTSSEFLVGVSIY